MSVTKVLLDILVVLLAAKAAAEVAERLGVPAVVGEILAGIAIGPSALGLVHGDEVLRVLAELGVILLLFDVGLEMDIGELAAVGRASLAVASVGVVVPFVAGYGASVGLGMSSKEALFVGAALTATSVGITARVFGDLRALGSVEARTVLGAAVADDVMGLVILTVVVRIAAEGTVSATTVVGVIALAVAFLLVTTSVGIRIAPRLFDLVARSSRSSGTLVAVALAFTLGVSSLANAAKLAPIVGAFVAGVSISRSPVAGRIRREITPVGHLFIPVFFLQIGIDARLSEFAHVHVLGIAAVLLAVAVVGKVVSAAGLWRAPGDRLLVGIGMIPRGEVGLIFATIGLREHVFGQDVYAALLLVVLATTLLPPPALKWRLLRLRAHQTSSVAAGPEPPGGWLRVVPGAAGGLVELAAEPPVDAALPVALQAALLCVEHRPGSRLVDWLARLPDLPLRWDRGSRDALFALLERGGPRSWRFLSVTGMLDRALPELGAALARRQADAFELDPTGALQWPRLGSVLELDAFESLGHPEWLLLAAVLLDATDGQPDSVVTARRVVQRLDLGAAAEQAIAGMVEDAELLAAAARRLDGLSEESVLQLAVHVGKAEQARALYLLARASSDLEVWEAERLSDLHGLLHEVLARPDLTGRDAANAVEQRKAEAKRLASSNLVRDRIGAAPRSYVLTTSPADLAQHAALCEPPPRNDEVRVEVSGAGDNEWTIVTAARDRLGLLARSALALSAAGFNVTEATVATWGDGCALAAFRIHSRTAPDADALKESVTVALRGPLVSPPAADADLVFDDLGSPWHTVATLDAVDRPGLLHAVTTAFAVSGVNVHAAHVHTADGRARDVFELTDGNGRKLSADRQSAVRTALLRGSAVPRRRFGRSRRAAASTQMLDSVRDEDERHRAETLR